MADFFGSRGFFGGGHGHGHHEEESQEVDNKQLYEALELTESASQADIKSAYKKLVRIHHPDKGGDETKFKEVQAAYEILNDPEKRKVYDKYGLEGLKGGNMGHGGFGDIFDIFFGRGRQQGKKQVPQLKPTVLPLKISLEDVYNGKMATVDVNRKVLCAGCNGKGGSQVEKCPSCKGRGVVIKMVQLGPGMYTQTQAECFDCEASGERIKKEHICKDCKGKKLLDKKEKVEVPVAAGVPEGEKILIAEKGNEHPEYRAGDLVIVIQIEPHKLFKRSGNDLIIEKSIGLIEALVGFEFNVHHLNGTEVTIKTKPNDTVQHKSARKIADLGMPRHKQAFSHGDLILIINVIMPANLSKEQIEGLKGCLNSPLLPKAKQTKNTYSMEKHEMKATHKASEYEDEEEEGEDHQGGGGQKVQCNQQ